MAFLFHYYKPDKISNPIYLVHYNLSASKIEKVLFIERMLIIHNKI